ncbi:hypothetical protein DENSPDRAFT_855134 [Dentipellis sp. KUC8613]|nr:hypothetical protein DENSPDRAFT_855134 [Dentipellis sp. KUC8613]
MIEATLPAYFVYHSVLLAVEPEMLKPETQENRIKIERSPIRDPWNKMRSLAMERVNLCSRYGVGGAVAMGPQFVPCDNECQVAAWKKGHRADCKLEKEEHIRTNLKKKDRTFLGYIAIRDACHNLLRLRSLAMQKFPDEPLTKIGVRNNYICLPEAYDVFVLNSEDEKASEKIRATGLESDLEEYLDSSEETGMIVNNVNVKTARIRSTHVWRNINVSFSACLVETLAVDK